MKRRSVMHEDNARTANRLGRANAEFVAKPKTWNWVVIMMDGNTVRNGGYPASTWRNAAVEAVAQMRPGMVSTDPVFIAASDGTERHQYTVGELREEIGLARQ